MNKVLPLAVIALVSLTLLPRCKKDGLYGEVKGNNFPIVTAVKTTEIPKIGGYVQVLPRSYHYDSLQKLFPTIIFFPGAGGYGVGDDKLQIIMNYGILKHANEKKFPATFNTKGEAFSFLVFAPQFIDQPLLAEVQAFIDYVKANYRVDTHRIYLVGASVGARTACDYAAEHAAEIAALLPLAGCSDFAVSDKAYRIGVNKLPVWGFHNRDDQVWPIASQLNFMSELAKYSDPGIPKLTIFENGQGESNHDAWTIATEATYKENGLNIYEWMLQYSR